MAGQKLEVDIRTKIREQWSIVRISIFLIIGYSLLLVGDSRCRMSQLVFWKGVLDVIVVHRLS